MLYEAKQGTKAYEYIKSILDAEFEEHKAYMKRVEEAVGFKFEKYQGYQPNGTLTRVYEITAIWVPSERYDTLDKKVWKKHGTQENGQPLKIDEVSVYDDCVILYD